MPYALAQNRVALVIGNNHYGQLDADHQLQKAINDAQAVGDALLRDGFQVLRGTDLTRAEMVDKLYDLTSRLQPGDTALFYFAGHGVALGSGNYLLPTDVPDVAPGQEMRIASQSIAEADVISSMQDKGARVSIVILDACRDNPFKKTGARSVGLERGFGRMPEANGVFSLYSAGYGQSALDRLSDDDRNPNSVFTRVLVPLLTRPGLNLDDLAYEIREDVAKLAATTPDHHEQIPAAYDQIIGGRVYLVRDSASADQAVSSRATSLPVPTSAAPTPPTTPTPATLAALETPKAVEPARSPPSEASLAAKVQAELNRLGCNAGAANGDWTVQSRMALLQFSLKEKLTLNVDQPDQSMLDRLQTQKSAVCPPLVKIPHSPEPKRAAIPHRAPSPVVRNYAPHPPAARAPAAAGSCFMFNGQRVCE
ncbi:caspase family protein [Lichenifustis flavocetrariae]|uniref:Caspase family protein n=1 Tax=Lichenifustis flavocetrariae TaxID=2949735 RepID=A0AA41YXY7_9HYPH|nr:caspase family protein [Lichenifustis flavocetrariae]MCW6509360.1 caspase family protein [Lichenifustis flavocetrariae]